MFALIVREVIELETGICDWHHPLAFEAKADADDNPNFYQALNGPDIEGFCEAIDKEIQQLLDKQTWDVVEQTIPNKLGVNIVGTTWAFKRKRFPNGSIRKLKARLCVQGDQQIKGVDYFYTLCSGRLMDSCQDTSCDVLSL